MLGDEAKFIYDPIKKRYIFPDDPADADDDLKPPPPANTKK